MAHLLLRGWERLRLLDGVLHHEVCNVEGKDVLQLVLPKGQRALGLKALHDDFEHMGVEHTLALAWERFFWLQMVNDIRTKCLNCECCVKQKTLQMRTAYVHTIQTSQPLELIYMDFLSIEGEGNQKGNILLITEPLPLVIKQQGL